MTSENMRRTAAAALKCIISGKATQIFASKTSRNAAGEKNKFSAKLPRHAAGKARAKA